MMHTPPPDDGSRSSNSYFEPPLGATPTRPRPSEDRGFLPPTIAPRDEPDAIPSDPSSVDITTLSPLAALRLLTATADALVRKSFEPPTLTPPSSNPNTPRMQGISDRACPEAQPEQHHQRDADGTSSSSPDHQHSPNSHHHYDIPHPHKTPIGSPETHPSEPSSSSGSRDEAFSIADESTQQTNSPPSSQPQQQQNSSSDPANPAPAAVAAAEIDDQLLAQYQALSRKFYSKQPPPIPLGEYLKRLHTYCPMSTAVYLAAGWYLQRLSGALRTPAPSPAPPTSTETDPMDAASGARDGEDNKENGTEGNRGFGGGHLTQTFVLPVTPKTAHRLLLAVLRVATKTLEDRTYPHARFAKVGGVSEKELARLEISCAFLLNFELLLGAETMTGIARRMVARWIAEGAMEG